MLPSVPGSEAARRSAEAAPSIRNSAAGSGNRVRRLLYLTHRWLGIAACMLFAIWFASGLVMLHVPFPKLTAAETRVGLPAIDWQQVRVQPASLASARSLVLEMRGRRAVWRTQAWDDKRLTTIDAATGQVIGNAGRDEAATIAASFGDAPVVDLEAIHNDQWSVAGRYDPHRPLWKAELGGAAGRVLYVSSTTGAVVLDTDRRERFWNWLGSVPHWIYPTVLRQDQPLWRQVVLWVSGPAILVAATGMWIGILRTRPGRRRYGKRRMTPYRGWMHWHHVAGLAGGVFLTLWIFSGWLSVDPGRLFASEGVGDASRQAYATAPTTSIDLRRLAMAADGAVRVELLTAANARSAVVWYRDGASRHRDLARFDTLVLPAADIVAAASKLVTGGRLAGVDRLTAPDAYWYDPDGDLQLPILRLRYDDEAATSLHIDPATGVILGEVDARRRLYRWLFDLFHRWDLNVLQGNPRVILVWLLSLAGLVTSVSAARLGWQRLVRRRARPEQAPTGSVMAAGSD
jgi:uncharacterized iron-regulated membrane protein